MKTKYATTAECPVHVSVCPITMGLETRMTETAARKLCEHHTSERAHRGFSLARTSRYDEMCKTCGGKFPSELTITTLEEMQMAKDKSGTCEVCARPDMSLTTNNGKKCCSSCSAIRGQAKHRPEILVQLLQELSPHALPVVERYVGDDVGDGPSRKDLLAKIGERDSEITRLKEAIADLGEKNGSLVKTAQELNDKYSKVKSLNEKYAETHCKTMEILKADNNEVIIDVVQAPHGCFCAPGE